MEIRSINTQGYTIIAALLGYLLSFSSYPNNLYFFLPISFTLLLECFLRIKPRKQVFWAGYFFGFGYFIQSLSWTSNALDVELDKFYWLKPFAFFGIPALLSFYTGLIGLIVAFSKPNRLFMWWIFCVTWVLMEVVRSYFLFPFPWNLIGYSVDSLYISQIASVVGIYGISFLVVACSSVFFTRSLYLISSLFLLLLCIFISGKYIVDYNHTTYKVAKVRVVQPSPDKHHMGDKHKRIELIHNLIKLSNSNEKFKPDIIVWPEAAIPISHHKEMVGLMDLLPKGAWLVSGADRVSSIGGEYLYYNSIIGSDHGGNNISIYDKHILVPFGEYIPLRWIMPEFIDKIAYGMGDFSVGGSYNLLHLGQLNAIPFICYEGLFSFYVSNFKLSKANLLLNITNDSWFGDSIQPYQHLHMTKFRAIEYGLPLIRAANTGISAVFDVYGRNLGVIPLNKPGVLDVNLELALGSNTFYGKNGRLIKLIGIIVVVFSFILLLNKNLQKRNITKI